VSCGNAITQRSEPLSTSRLVSVCLISQSQFRTSVPGTPGPSARSSARTRADPPYSEKATPMEVVYEMTTSGSIFS
jgi:hypothetical protein